MRGQSYDSGYQDGYEIAYRINGDWAHGKQEDEMYAVTHWAALPTWSEAWIGE